MSAKEFLGQLDRWGVRYREHDGWSKHDRPGAWGDMHGVLLHHTGDDAPDTVTYRVLRDGHGKLPGPLCQWGMRDDGVVDLVGWGRANHAGRGSSIVRDAVIAEDYDDYPPRPGPDDTDGNSFLYGQETMYSGRRPPSEEAYDATVLVFAAVCEFHGWSAKSCIGHKEFTRRKVDPGSLDMKKFRRDVQKALDAGPPKAAETDRDSVSR